MRKKLLRYVILAVLLALPWPGPASAQKSEPWSTFRGNPQRTGNTDGLPGPTSPKILWAHKSRDHHLSSPVVFGDRLFIAGLTGFNSGYVSCFSTDPTAKERVLWSKSAPLLRLPTVSSPAIMEGRIVFGDGMHQ